VLFRSPENIIKTLKVLHARIGERFPKRGLSAVAAELVAVAERNRLSARRTTRPWIPVRIGVAAVIIAGISSAVWGLWMTHLFDGGVVATLAANGSVQPDTSLFETTEAAVNLVLLTAAGIFFLTRTEERLKRRRILRDLHELRSLAHVVDMHQLTKDPSPILKRGDRTKSSPVREMTEFQLTRYLDYCAEMLALIGKLGALYAQNMRDPVVIQAVNEIETLTAGLAGKIWQKIMIIQGFAAEAAARGVAMEAPPPTHQNAPYATAPQATPQSTPGPTSGPTPELAHEHEPEST